MTTKMYLFHIDHCINKIFLFQKIITTKYVTVSQDQLRENIPVSEDHHSKSVLISLVHQPKECTSFTRPSAQNTYLYFTRPSCQETTYIFHKTHYSTKCKPVSKDQSTQKTYLFQKTILKKMYIFQKPIGT